MVDVSVVVPVLNGAGFIGRNVELVAAELDAAGLDYEIIVVSDGSIDDTFAEASAASVTEVRVLHYDRNLGKGYAVRTGLLASRGSYVGFIDADLDLHPAALPAFVEAMRERGLDAAIGSKRHPLSQVSYSRRRRLYSSLYQILVCALFRLNVRDTQVGIKLFRRELVDAVAPHLLVKRFAFDLELLAVARDFGFTKVEELPVRLEHGGHMSAIRIGPIANALWDTLAVFYRLRILRYYHRRRALFSPPASIGSTRSVLVAIVDDRSPEPRALERTLDALHRLDPQPARIVVDVAGSPGDRGGSLDERRLRAVTENHEDVVAFLRAASIPATHWLARLEPLLESPGVVAAGGPVISAEDGTLRTAASSALYESLFAFGRRSRMHVPGNLRVGQEQDLDNLLLRRVVAVDALGTNVPSEQASLRAIARAGVVVGVPDAPVVRPLPPLVTPLLRHVELFARTRPLRTDTAIRAGIGGILLALATSGRTRGATVLAYGSGLAISSAVAAFKHRSLAVGLVFAVAAPAVHAARGLGIARAALRREPDFTAVAPSSDPPPIAQAPMYEPLRRE